MATFLTGRQARKTGGADLRVGVSVDQLAAADFGQSTRFPSLEVGCEGGRDGGGCDHGYSCAYQTNLSWRTRIDAGAQRSRSTAGFRAPVRRPACARQGLACGHAASATVKASSTSSAEDARHLRARLGAADRRKLDEYLDGVREVERRIASMQPAVEVGQGSTGPTDRRPAGLP